MCVVLYIYGMCVACMQSYYIWHTHQTHMYLEGIHNISWRWVAIQISSNFSGHIIPLNLPNQNFLNNINDYYLNISFIRLMKRKKIEYELLRNSNYLELKYLLSANKLLTSTFLFFYILICTVARSFC